jgi:hypothetical protein
MGSIYGTTKSNFSNYVARNGQIYLWMLLQAHVKPSFRTRFSQFSMPSLPVETGCIALIFFWNRAKFIDIEDINWPVYKKNCRKPIQHQTQHTGPEMTLHPSRWPSCPSDQSQHSNTSTQPGGGDKMEPSLWYRRRISPISTGCLSVLLAILLNGHRLVPPFFILVFVFPPDSYRFFILYFNKPQAPWIPSTIRS